MSRYPKLKVDLPKLRNNLKKVKNICDERGIAVSGVIKGCNGIVECSKVFAEAGLDSISSSRISHLKRASEAGIEIDKLLIRIPMLSEIEDVVRYTTSSLNSDMKTVRLINEEAKRQGKIHRVILMDDIGDLREGFWETSELVEAAKEIEFKLENIILDGIGTNLGCYGALENTKEKMQELVEDAQIVEEAIGRKLKYISGGGTLTMARIFDETMPERVNLLRIGEGILLARDLMDIWPEKYGKMYQDVFTLDMQVVENRDKPTYPVGKISRDGFGLEKQFVDEGIKRRVILAGGKIDYGFPEMLIPTIDGIKVWGASSDHTLVDCEAIKDEIEIGDILSFELSYANLVYTTESTEINIEIVE